MEDHFSKSFLTCCLRHEDAFTLGNCQRCGASLPRNKDGSLHKTRRWCSRRCANEMLRQHRWHLAKKAALKRDGFVCQMEGCSTTTTLEVHHIVPRNGRGYYAGCHNHHNNLITYCRKCHVQVTKAHMQKDKT